MPGYYDSEGNYVEYESGDTPYSGAVSSYTPDPRDIVNYNPEDKWANTYYDPSVAGPGRDISGPSMSYDPKTGINTLYDPQTGETFGSFNAGKYAVASGSTSGSSGIKGISTQSVKNLLGGFLDKNGNIDIMKALLGLAAFKSMRGEQARQQQARGYQGGIPKYTATRSKIEQPAYVPYSGQPVMGSKQLTDVKYAAAGGIMGLRDGAFVIPADVVSHFGNGSSEAGMAFLAKKLGATPIKGKGDGMSDSIPTTIDGKKPAKVANEEMLVSPEDVKRIGGGDSDKGAKKLYAMMDRVRHARTGTKKQGKQINPSKFTPGGIAGYAGGGAVAFPDGGAVTNPSTGSSTTSNLSEWAGPYVTDMLGKTQALTNQPYEAYTGPLTAGYSPLQQQAYQGYQGLNTQYGPVSGTFTGENAQQYMNPYLSATLGSQLGELNRANQISQMGQQAKLAQAGAFGGSRDAIMRAENERNLGQQQSNLINTTYSQAFDKAMGQFNTEQTNKMRESEFGAKYGLDALAAQRTAGAEQRGIEQEGITAKLNEFEKQRLYPYQQLQFQQSMLRDLPVSTYSNVAQTSGMGDLATFLRQLYGIGQSDTGVAPVGPA